MQRISQHQIAVSLWGVGAHLLRTLLWTMIGVNSAALVLLTWTNLTGHDITSWSVPIMAVVIVLMMLCESADQAAVRANSLDKRAHL